MSKIIVPQSTPVVPGQPGSLFGAGVPITCPVGNTPVPAGHWMIPGTTDVTIEVYDAAGAFIALTSAGTGTGSILSDGASVQLTASVATTVTAYPYLD